jgi:hypothetical protein
VKTIKSPRSGKKIFRSKIQVGKALLDLEKVAAALKV